MNQRFQHKVAIVTAGGAGIGAATATGLAREGAAVMNRPHSELRRDSGHCPRGDGAQTVPIPCPPRPQRRWQAAGRLLWTPARPTEKAS